MRIERKDNSGAAPDLEVKKAIGDLATAFEEFKKTHATEISEVKKGQVDVVTTEKLGRINTAIDELVEAKAAAEKRANELEAKINRTGLGEGSAGEKEIAKEVKAFNAERRSNEFFKNKPDVTADEYTAYKAAFVNAIRTGNMQMLSDAERKAMSVGTDTDGGYVVPATISAEIVKRVFETSDVRQLVGSETISTDALEGLRDIDEATNGGWVSEMGTRSITATPKFGKWRIPVHEMYCMPSATQQLLDDAVVNIESWLADKVADKMTRVENAAFITGTGTGQPRGFASYTTVATADSSRAWGQLEHVATGVSADFASANPADKLFDLEAAFKPQYLANAKIATRRTVVQKIRKMKDGNGQYLWQPGLVLGKPQTVLGYPVVLLEDMAALASDSLSLAMGDFKRAYKIVDRQGFRVIRDNLTSKPYVIFYTTRRVGGDVLQFEALKFLKFGAS